jgi:PKD repeat protein
MQVTNLFITKKNLLMKRYISYLASLLLLSVVWTACSPDMPTLGTPPTPDQVVIAYTPDPSNPNIIHFRSEGPGFIAKWDFGNGTSSEGLQATGTYPLQGEYTVTLTIFTKDGHASNSTQISIANTNPLLLDREDYNFLTGGAAQAGGKTWVIEKDMAGHLAIGPSTSYDPEWYRAGANEKADEGYYDDEMTFKLEGFSYVYDNKGGTFSNGANAPGLGGAAGTDYTVPYTPQTGLTWSISEQDGKKYLTISNGGFIGYYTGVSRYEILTLSENELYIRFGDAKNAAHAWYQRLVPKGYTRPRPEKPLRTVDMFDTFDMQGNMQWNTNEVDFRTNFDNPASLQGNTSEKVGRYIKGEGEGHAFDNLKADYAHKIDLSQRHIYKIKVFMPGYNDYTTQRGFDWAPTKNLAKQVALKLQNSETGEPWQTQAEVVAQVTELDRWVELTFDFSAFKDRKDFDRIVLQLGGEGHFNPGTFFIDDFRLMP